MLRQLRSIAANAVFYCGLTLLFVTSAHATVPAVVMSNHQALYTGLTNGTYRVAANARGDVFFADYANNTIDELPAGSTTPVVLLTKMNGPHSVDIDSAGNVYANDTYAGKVVRIPFVNGTYPAGIDATTVVGVTVNGVVTVQPVVCSNGLQTDCSLPTLGAATGYYAQITDTAIDGAGNYYFIDISDNISSGKYNRIVELTAGGVVKILVDGLTTAYNAQIVSDAAGNLYYANGTSLFTIPAGASAATAVNTTTLTKPTGVTLDAYGNLIVTDSGNSRIVVMPFENGAINFANQYLLAPYYSQNSVGIDSFGTIYYTGSSSGASAINALQTSAYNAPALAVGSSSTLALVYSSFNASTTFSQYVVRGNGATISYVGNSCTIGTTYTANQSCSYNVQIKPNRVGPVSGLVGIGDSAGNYLAQFSLSTVGLGSAISIDPGTSTSIGSGFISPAGVAVDKAGNIFIADPSANAVYELVGGTGTPVSVGSGLVRPDGVAVDAAGDLFIADTGNSRVVRVPVIGAVLTTASQSVVASSLTAPLSIAAGPLGSVYIAQAGQLARYAVRGIPGIVPTAILSTSYYKPSALTVDPSGNIFLADSAAGTVVEFAAYTGAQTTIASSLSTPTGLATDSAGNLFIADNGTAQVVRIANTSGSLTYSNAVSAGTFASPFGAAVDSSGNLIVSDPSVPAVYRVARTSGTLNFGTISQGTTSSLLSGSILSCGNQSLTLGTPLSTATGDTTHFTISSSSTCTAAQVLAAGSACTIAATFSPTAKATSSEVLTVSSSPTVATPVTLTLNGTGTYLAPTTLAVALTSPTGTLTYGQTATFTATLTPSLFNVAAATGTVTFNVNGTVQKPVAISNNTATFQISTLPGGVNSISASYSGDVNYAASAASAIATTVAQGTTTTTVSVVAAYTNPVSSLPNSSITFTATVTPSVVGVLTGSVNFVSGTTVLGTALLGAGSGGTYQAVLTTSSIPVGNYNVAAVFPGSTNYTGSTSATTPLIVSISGIKITSSSSTLTSTPSTPGGVTLSVYSVAGLGPLAPGAPVTFSCTGLPAYATCLFNPAYISLLASPYPSVVAATTVGLTITTNVAPTVPLPPVSRLNMHHNRLTFAAIFALPLLVVFRRRALLSGRISGFLLLIFTLGSLSLFSGCNGSSATSNAVTPTGSYIVTVNAISSTASASVPLTLTVSGQ
ncbi:MAG: Ig-like domain repeat protein [Acidobacteriaceae bacterium]|nr:Ig-like domain repeat protein [Acidobacteriaceae bacterium]